MEYMDVKAASERWNLSDSRITTLCRNNRIEGARKIAGVWEIPVNAEKPHDARTSRTRTKQATGSNKPLPIGVSDFKEIVSKYYYVDKTLMIKEFVDSRPKVSLFTRPRRFGKTLTMDMFKTFFEISDSDTSKYFENMEIWSCGEKYRSEQGKYPVIFVTFKDVKFPTWEQAYASICEIIAKEYQRHDELLTTEKCNDLEKEYFRSVLDGSATDVSMMRAFQELSAMLCKHYGCPAIIIIDEYDTPIQKGYMEGYYEEIIGFMRNLLSGAFKDNASLAFGFLTGILRIAKESIFSGLNNLTIHSIMDEKFSAYFGFTADEVKKMAEFYDASEKYDEICSWYDGYRFGSHEIFNPWSVINYFYNDCLPRAYWLSTGDNSVIRQIVSEADDETSDNLRKLMQGQTIYSYVDTSVIYPEVRSNPSTIYSFLLAAGYLKITKKDEIYDGNAICDIAIPNREISFVYEKEILSALSEAIPQSTAIAIQQSIIRQDVPKLQEALQKLLLGSVSAFDYAHENFYHGLMLGICAIMNNLYHVDSNRESGHGRYDIQLSPFNKCLPGVIIELKVLKEGVPEEKIDDELDKSARAALKQIDEKEYVTAMREKGVTQFLKMGVAFYKKRVKIQTN